MAGAFFCRAGSPWNQKLPATAPIHSASATIVADLAQMLTEPNLSFPTTSWNINVANLSCPIYYATSATSRVPVTIMQSDDVTPTVATRNGDHRQHLQWLINQQGGVPIPAGATPAAGSDAHMTVVNTDTGELWEFWHAAAPGTTPPWLGSPVSAWRATFGGYIADHRRHPGVYEDAYDGQGNRLSYATWGSMGTALPIVGGLMLTSELQAGVIPHALHLATPSCDQTEHWWPAHRRDSLTYRASALKEGAILRLPATFDTTTIAPGGGERPDSQAARTLRMILAAARDYGIVVTDHADALALRAEPSAATGYDFGTSDFHALLANFPISQLQVIKPGWRPSAYEAPPIGEHVG